MLTHIWHFMRYDCPAALPTVQVYLILTLHDSSLTVGNHEPRQSDGAHNDGPPGGQAWIFQLVNFHHGSVGCELVCHRFAYVFLSFFL